MTYLPQADIFVRLVNLPPSIGGIVTPNDDGTFSVYINANRPSERQIASYFHELEHIENDDFYTDKDIKEIENL